MSVKLQFLGTGDASASGGRMFTCFYAETSGMKFLIDCGATALTAMKKYKIPHTEIDAILLTHFHGDHFTGIPFFIIDVRLYNRTKPLYITGPAGVEKKINESMELFFPGSFEKNSFPIIFHQYSKDCGEITLLEKIKVKPFKVKHSEDANPHGLRVEADEKIIVYSGDTEWTDALLSASENADIFICECSSYDKKIENHMDYFTLLKHRQELKCRKIILTHAGEKMLGKENEIEFQIAREGLRFEI